MTEKMTPDSNTELFGLPCAQGQPPLLIAELSGNHGGKLENALAMIDAAAKAGADAIKLQTYTADTLTIQHDSPAFVIQDGLWKGRTLYDLYQEAHTPWEWHPALFQRAHELGIPLFSSPFDSTAVDFLEKLECPAYKIASFEIIDIPLIRKVAETGKPIIISTGMASLDEIDEAVDCVNSIAGHGPLFLLHCTSGYPTPVTEARVRNIPFLHRRYNLPIGLSDHSTNNTVAISAVALGACIIEKHFIISREKGGVDAKFSLEPEEFRQLADDCKQAWNALGDVDFGLSASESIHQANRRSLYAVRDIQAGKEITGDNVRSIRPGGGLHPKHLDTIIGKKAAHDIARGTPIKWEDIV